MKKADMVKMLNAAQEVSTESLTADLSVNDALKEGIFWAHAKMNLSLILISEPTRLALIA